MSHPIIDDLHQAAQRIRQAEAEARTAIGGGDEACYRQLYAEKVDILLGLPERVASHVATLPDELAMHAVDEAEGFARRAGMARRLNSIFFMYALLYPDDYKDGEPNDLERFIAELEADLDQAESSSSD